MIAIPISKYPCDFIPAGAKTFIGVDYGSERGCTVSGFIDGDGAIHIQDVSHAEYSQTRGRQITAAWVDEE